MSESPMERRLVWTEKQLASRAAEIAALRITLVESESLSRVGYSLLAKQLIRADRLAKQVTLLRDVLLSYDGSHSIDQWDEELMPSRAWDRHRKEALAATKIEEIPE